MRRKLHLTLVVLLTAFSYLSAQTNKMRGTDEASSIQSTELNRSMKQGSRASLTASDSYNVLGSHLTIAIKDQYSVGLDDYIVSAPNGNKRATDNFKLKVQSTQFNASEIHFGLFTLQDEPVFLKELKFNVSDSTYSVPSGTANAEYIVQPYVVKSDGTKQVLTRPANSYFIDKLRLVVNTPSQMRSALSVNTDVSTSKHMRINSLNKGCYTVNKGDSFTVYASAGQGNTRIGLFSRDNGSFVADITKSSYGDVYTCVVPSSIRDANYIMMPYRTVNGTVTIIERAAGTNIVDRLPLVVHTSNVAALEEHLSIDLSTTDNLYKINSGTPFLIKAKATSVQNQVRIGLFAATTGVMLIQDITGSYKGDGVYECTVSAYLESGRYIIEPYIMTSNNVMMMVTRPEKSNLIDKLPIVIHADSTVIGRRMAVYDLSDIGATNHMRLTTEAEGRYIVDKGEIFTVYATAGQGTSKVGLFDRATGAFVTDIVKSSYGDVYTCQVPTTVAQGDYVIMPYRYQNNVLKVIERKPGLSSVDRIPVQVTNLIRENLVDHLQLDLTSTHNVYRVETSKAFKVKAVTDGDPQIVRIGLFERTEQQKLICDITSSYLGNNMYECILSDRIGKGNYIVQPYIDNNGVISLINRFPNEIWIDRLPLAVSKPTTRSAAYDTSDLTTTRHMRFIMPKDDYYAVNTGKPFVVYVAAGQGTSRVGLFDIRTAQFVADIVSSAYGDTYTCQIPSTVAVGDYMVMPYRQNNDSIEVIERPTGSNLIDRLPIKVGDNTQADLIDHLQLDLTSTDDLYSVSSITKPFRIKAVTNGNPEVIHIGVFERTEQQKLISDITSSYLGDNVYECVLPARLGNGNYIIQAYLNNDGEIVLIDRLSSSIWIDRLPLAVNDPTKAPASGTRSLALTTTRHMRFTMPKDNYYTVNSTDPFIVYVAAGQGASRVGLFDIRTAQFITDIVSSAYGDTYTCRIPSTIDAGEYMVMAYRKDGSTIKTIERPSNSNLIDRLPIQVNKVIFSARGLTTDDINEASVALYPNPVVDALYVRNLSETAKVDMYNLSGNLVKSVNLEPNENIDVQTLPSGIYVVKITTHSGKTITSKIKKD